MDRYLDLAAAAPWVWFAAQDFCVEREVAPGRGEVLDRISAMVRLYRECRIAARDRGIAARQFQRAFVLAEGIEVKGAWLDNGLLHVDLARPQPEVRVRTIQINKPAPAKPVVDATPDVAQDASERG